MPSKITHVKNKLVGKRITCYSLLLMYSVRKLKKNKVKSQKQREEFSGHHRGKEEREHNRLLRTLLSQKMISASIKYPEMTQFKLNFSHTMYSANWNPPIIPHHEETEKHKQNINILLFLPEDSRHNRKAQ